MELKFSIKKSPSHDHGKEMDMLRTAGQVHDPADVETARLHFYTHLNGQVSLQALIPTYLKSNRNYN
ncbi:hypothetical protein [Arenibacter lacus]|uniref:hypothetical protein n=1 Tax=Arenibacter lacus TaxID=2608629 RepID=UPI00123E4100|nr:hypothetical protein [Arenibacter lacus]